MSGPLRVAAGVLAAAVLAAGAGAGANAATAQPVIAGAAATPAEPACFGAAARDPKRPCSNPTLSVFPTAEEIDADYVAGLPCEPVAANPAPICSFGVSRKQAKRTFALIGDSHALHWRRTVEAVALGEKWRGYSLTTAGCPFTAAVHQLPMPLRETCVAWYDEAMAWFKRHSEVSTVFTSSFAPLPVEVDGVPSGGGKAVTEIKIAGYRRAWTSLPRSVKHVIHIRDNPLTSQATFDCVQAAIAAGTQPAGTACAVPRHGNLRYDTAIAAARALHSRRYQYADLSEQFCDATQCFPVVGGARVYRDPFGHITTAYARTLGPFLLRKVRALMKSW